MRRAAGVVVLLIGVFAAGLTAAGIHAGPTAIWVTTVEATVQLTTTEPAVTTAEAPTTTPTTTALPAPKGTVVRPAAHGIAGNCLLVGGLALLGHGVAPLVLGPVAEPPKLEDA